MRIATGVAVALVLASTFLFFALWNPVAALLPAAVFILVTIGVLRRRAWSAYGGALFLLSLAAVAVVGLARLKPPPSAWLGIALGTALFPAAAWLLYRAGRSMPALSSPGSGAGSRRVWIALAAVVFLFPQIMRPYVISAGSMEPTLLTGDLILTRPAGAPTRGELVNFLYPVDRSQIFIKRVVAVGGDRVRIDNKRLLVNESPVNEPYVVHYSRSLDAFRDNFPSEPNIALPQAAWPEELKRNTVNGELVVPAGKYFVLGDNRDNSLDSRYWGFLETKDLIGRPAIVYFSSEASPAQLSGRPFASPPVLLHPSTIRWGRMLKTL